ncbi:MAG: hypothetical protein MUC77_13100 [Chromatiaceae bacterium]|jgi:hypothetical protein|nr:hypothetical protein [Chromatiaceae bacterium]
MTGKLIRPIGLGCAEVKIGLMTMTYDLMRYLQLTKRRIDAPVSRGNRSFLVRCISRY